MAESLNDNEEFKRETVIPSIKTNIKEGRKVTNKVNLRAFDDDEIFLRDQFLANDP